MVIKIEWVTDRLKLTVFNYNLGTMLKLSISCYYFYNYELLVRNRETKPVWRQQSRKTNYEKIAKSKYIFLQKVVAN